MLIDRQALLDWDIPEVTQTITQRDTILYALGIGMGSNPVDLQQLKFVSEADLKTLPTMAVVLCYPGQWHANPGTGIVSSHVVQGAQRFVIHRALPPACTVRGKTRVKGVYDKGAGRGALVITECVVFDVASGNVLCTIGTTHFCRANGGFGGPGGSDTPSPEFPLRKPDVQCELETLPQAGLIYRLSGDRNPLHVDPEYAKRAGFKVPILHGRCTFGVAGHGILKSLCGYDDTRLKGMSARFVAPVYPGETICTEMWVERSSVFFRARVKARDVVVLDAGVAEIDGL